MCKNILITAIVLIATLELTHAWRFICYNGSVNNSVILTSDNFTELVKYSDYFNVTRRTVVYTHGYNGSATKSVTVAVLTAYLTCGDGNVCLIDWEDEAKASALSANYPSVAATALEIGKQLGTAWVHLTSAGFHFDVLHCVGLSLGAHLMGAAGRQVTSLGYQIPWITGCDPAKPEFDGSIPLLNRLDTSCAAFVDIIHTNPEKYGMETSTGTIDFFVNHGSILQPGCPLGVYPTLSDNEVCSQARSALLLAAAICNPTSLMASKAGNYADWVASNGTGSVTYIGDLINKTLSGNFYLSTNGEAPYGKGEAGLRP